MSFLDTFLGKKNGQKGRYFLLGDGVRMSPYEYGRASIHLSIDSSGNCLDQLIKGLTDTECDVATRLRADPDVAQFELIAVGIAVLYVYAGLFLHVPSDISEEIDKGISDALTEMWTDADVSALMVRTQRGYSNLLAVEVQSEPRAGLLFNGGVTANAVFDRIKRSYNPPLEVDPLNEYLMKTTIFACSTIGHVNALAEMKVSFIP